ncbi:MAG: IMP dehydrogenase [Lacunisphaera sp.]
MGEISGKLYKQYRGMGSHAAMKAGSAARYGHDKNDTVRKVAAEGIEALKEVSGSVDDVLNALIGGVQSGHGLPRGPRPGRIAPQGALRPRHARRPEGSVAA